LVGLALLVSGCFGGSGGTGSPSGTPPPASTASYGNAEISAKATGKSYNRVVIIRAKTKKGGVPICGAVVSVYGLMTSPHTMALIPRTLHQISCGTYKGPYTLIMPGQWTLNIEVRSKKLGSSTSALPITVAPSG
jgi:hypothetical protein